MKTVMVDGKEVLVENSISGKEIATLTHPDRNQFPVITREVPGESAPQWIPVPRKGSKTYDVQDGDTLRNLHRVENG